MNNTYPPANYDARPPEIELIRSMVRKNPQKFARPYVPEPENDNDEAFIIKPAGSWLRDTDQLPAARKLFDGFWFEDELCILFADTNVGKSILAVQIGDSISKGQPIGNFEAPPQAPVLYFDFELSDKQFRSRYHSNDYGTYSFHPQFLRAVYNTTSNKSRKFGTFQDYINNELENALIATKAKVLIIDNITCLRYDTHAITGALNLLRSLQSLKHKYKLSILVLAHTPKRNPVKPLSRNDLQGSKMLINFCDSAFAIGESQVTQAQRYIKQIKQRSISESYGAENVCLCHIIKRYNFLEFEFVGYGRECAHLANYTEQLRKINEEQIHELHNHKLSIRQIAGKLNLSSATVHRVVKRLGNN